MPEMFINGVPVCIVEHKNPKDGDAIERGIKQLRRYEIETPELIGAPQIFNVTHLLDYWYGVTWNATRRDMARWKQTRSGSGRRIERFGHHVGPLVLRLVIGADLDLGEQPHGDELRPEENEHERGHDPERPLDQ